jgi:NDP-sugar pyrophosphorylase family protein
MSLPAVVLAGGLGTRLRAVTGQLPKSLVDVAGRPFAVHQIELLRRNQITDITFLVGHRGEAIANALGDGGEWGVRLRYVFDGPRLLGTGGALRAALPQLADPFFVLYGDSYLDCDYRGIAHAFSIAGQRALMTVYRNENRWDSSNVLFSNGRIIRYDKRAHSPEMRHIDYGLGVFRHGAFSDLVDGEPVDLATVYQGLLARNDLAGYEVSTRFYEIGSPAGLDETRRYLAGKDAPVG